MSQLLFLMRHGQTIFNVQHRIQGWCDSPLTIEGQNQAKRVKQYFKEHHITFDHVYSSTSERCCDTLELITDMPYTRLKGLKEMFYGELEGESERLNCKTPKECETYYLQFGGESSNDVRDRMVKTLTDIMEKEDHECVLAVSHGGACFNFLRAWQDPTEELKKGLSNCCIFIYEYDCKIFKLKNVIRQGE
jgi:Fructose-2,6-bisphosphatase